MTAQFNYEEIVSLLKRTDDFDFIIPSLHPGLDTEKDPVLALSIIGKILDYLVGDDSAESYSAIVCEAYLSYRKGEKNRLKAYDANSSILVNRPKIFTCVDLITYLDGNSNFANRQSMKIVEVDPLLSNS